VESAQNGNWSKVGEGGIRRGKGERGKGKGRKFAVERGARKKFGRGTGESRKGNG